MTNEENLVENKKHRKRKRARGMYKTIVHQMEFYLGDANMAKSSFLKELMEKSPWIDLDIFLTFNKLVGMLRDIFGHADNTDNLWEALKSIPSDVFEIKDEPKRQIKRKNPIIPKDDKGDLRTIYVERLPQDVTLEMLQHVFTKYGPIDYISLPKFKHNGISKGFAFVEFANEDGAKNTLEAFIAAKRRIPLDLNPGELQSIKSYHIEQEHLQQVIDEMMPPTKKAKVQQDEPKEPSKEEEKTISKKTKEGGEKEKKEKKKRSRNHKIIENQVDPLTTLQLMPKLEWKRLRNKYLDLQKKKFSHSKMKFYQYNEHQKETIVEPPPPKLEFSPGIIVKFTLDEPIEDDKKVKQRIKAAVMENIKYVDARIGSTEYFVRCAHPEQAKTLANAKIFGQSEILTGKVEQDYWDKIMKDREDKITGKVKRPVASTVKKQRGKLRVMKKMDEMQQSENVHKYFNDDE